jgi:hypothetical protein
MKISDESARQGWVPIAVTVQQAAAITGMSVDVIRRAINAKKLVAHYPTSRPIVLVDELRAWIASSPTDSAAERRRRR